jgi:anti-anti-sigma regulatory factor
LEDLKTRIDAPVGNHSVQGDNFFAVDNDIVVLTLPDKITRSKAAQIEEMVKAKIEHMASAGANRFVLDVSQIANLNMATIQTVLSLVNVCLRAKLLIRLAATNSQAEALKGFKETSGIPAKLSVEAAKADF